MLRQKKIQNRIKKTHSIKVTWLMRGENLRHLREEGEEREKESEEAEEKESLAAAAAAAVVEQRRREEAAVLKEEAIDDCDFDCSRICCCVSDAGRAAIWFFFKRSLFAPFVLDYEAQWQARARHSSFLCSGCVWESGWVCFYTG